MRSTRGRLRERSKPLADEDAAIATPGTPPARWPQAVAQRRRTPGTPPTRCCTRAEPQGAVSLGHVWPHGAGKRFLMCVLQSQPRKPAKKVLVERFLMARSTSTF